MTALHFDGAVEGDELWLWEEADSLQERVGDELVYTRGLPRRCGRFVSRTRDIRIGRQIDLSERFPGAEVTAVIRSIRPVSKVYMGIETFSHYEHGLGSIEIKETQAQP